MDAAAEFGRNTVSTRFSVSIENEQADKRRDSQTCLAKPSQARTRARKFFPVQLTINRIGNLTQLICTLLYVMTTHAFVYYTVACTLNSRLLSGHLGVVAGTLRGARPYTRWKDPLTLIPRNQVSEGDGTGVHLH